jgi:hypothetical protein
MSRLHPRPVPPIREFLAERTIYTPEGVAVLCPRPEFRLSVFCGQPPRFIAQECLLDTGADVTLVPAHLAEAHQFVGYNRSAPTAAVGVSLNGYVEGRWGTLRIRVGERATTCPCLYYFSAPPRDIPLDGPRGQRRVAEQATDRWWWRFFRRLYRGQHAQQDSPLILGRAGLVLNHAILVQSDFVVVSDQPLLDLSSPPGDGSP